nr:excalibur calcium-binding domain-containing protein [Sphingopyxis sp. GW247-27LB]
METPGAAIPEGFELVPPSAEAVPEPKVAPVPLVSHEPSRAHGGRAFANCSEARAAGAAPVYASDPGYAPRLDRDGDGVGCE